MDYSSARTGVPVCEYLFPFKVQAVTSGGALVSIECPPHNNMGKFGIYNNTLFFNKNV